MVKKLEFFFLSIFRYNVIIGFRIIVGSSKYMCRMYAMLKRQSVKVGIVAVVVVALVLVIAAVVIVNILVAAAAPQ